MYHELITIGDEGDGWVRFTRAHGTGHHSHDSMQVPPGFTLVHVLAAVEATGWVAERNGHQRIHDRIGCDQLVRMVEGMLSYFDRPGEPGEALLEIKRQVDGRLGERSDGEGEWPLLAYAWLDLILREDVADIARSAESLWSHDSLTVDVRFLRDERLRELCRRYARTQVTAQTAASARLRDSTPISGKSAG
jgi:hypothetical protein